MNRPVRTLIDALAGTDPAPVDIDAWREQLRREIEATATVGEAYIGPAHPEAGHVAGVRR